MVSLKCLNLGLISKACSQTTPWTGSAALLSLLPTGCAQAPGPLTGCAQAPGPEELGSAHFLKARRTVLPAKHSGKNGLRKTVPDPVAAGKCGWHTPASQETPDSAFKVGLVPLSALSCHSQPSLPCLLQTHNHEIISNCMVGTKKSFQNWFLKGNSKVAVDDYK